MKKHSYVTIRISAEMLSKVRTAAKKEDRSIRSFVDHAISEALNK